MSTVYKHETFNQCCSKVGPTSEQDWLNVIITLSQCLTFAGWPPKNQSIVCGTHLSHIIELDDALREVRGSNAALKRGILSSPPHLNQCISPD